MYSLRQLFNGHPVLALIIAVCSISYASVASADGWPPFAIDDSATVGRGGTVSVLDSGQSSVLDNDFDFERDRLTSVLSQEPKHGELTLNDNGTFVYRHNGNSKKKDEFEYRAFDGTRYSRDATVRIAITPGPPIPPQIIDQNEVSVAEDQSLEIQLRDLKVSDPDSDYPEDFTLEVSDGNNYTRTGATVTPVDNYNGHLTIPVRVRDETNFSSWFNLHVDVIPQNDGPFVVAPVPNQEALEGDELVLSIAGHFGDIDEGDSLRFSANGLPQSGTIMLDAATGLLQGTPIRADANAAPYLVDISATDSAGSSATLTFELLILPNNRADLAISGNVNANPTILGEQTSWSIEIENQGPAPLDEGELVASWTTSGPKLSLTAPAGCVTTSNDSSAPEMRCILAQMPVGTTLSFDVQGMQDDGGDNTLIATVIADDPVADNNTTLVSSQVAIAFSEAPTQVLNQAGADLAISDFNSDGLPDLVASSDETIVYLNTGNRTLQTTGTTIGSGGSLLSLLDWNADGYDDVAVAGPSADSVRIYLGDGSGLFGDSIEAATRVQGDANALSGIDIDGDGTSELILGGSFGALIVRNQGTDQPLIDIIPGGSVLDIAVTDFDLDGFPDLVVVAADDRSVNLRRNSGDGTFVPEDTIQEGSVGRVNTADLDGDGMPDLLLAIDGDDLTPPYTQLLYRQSNGAYAVGNTLGASAASDLLTGDVDGDGRLDIIVVNEAGVHQVYKGGLGAQYTLDAEQIVSPGMRKGAVVDFNSDESLDLILVGVDVAAVELRANNGIGRLGLGDRTAPELNLIGATRVTITSGAAYVDEGATAIDDIDGDLTDAIVTSGSVNTTVVGTYTITYTVSDRASNTVQTSRTVSVVVNEGTGGGGGGVLSIFTLVIFGLIALLMRARQSKVPTELAPMG